VGTALNTQVRQPNAIQGSASLWLKKWVKVKYVPNEEDLALEEQLEKDKGTLELAHAIILEQMNNKT
jgi:hypothetical protein